MGESMCEGQAGGRRRLVARRLSRACGLLVVLLAAGCMAVGPDYQKPETAVPEGWRELPDPALVRDGAVVREWWTLFDDPLLNDLIAAAEAGNRNLRQAVARVKESRARLGVARGERLPQVEAQGSAIRQRGSENSLTGRGYTETLYRTGLDASWELDLFGRISRSVEAATADYQASEEERTDVLVSLYAEVARTYFAVRTYQARLIATRGNLESQQQVLRLTRSRFENGLATGLDVAQAEQVLAASQAEVPVLNTLLTQAIHNLSVLLGQPPAARYEQLSQIGPIPVPPEAVTVGVPADVLRQRPDIRRAERLLAAQTARIGLAKADLYPRLSLSGTFAFESIDAGDLFKGPSRVFGFGPTLRWLLFDGARVRSQVRVEDARTEQALNFYEQTVLNGLKEVESAMTEYLEQRERLAALERAVVAAQRSLHLATRLYRDGLVDFQSVLDAQRALFDSENLLAMARGNSVINLVDLYRALGGGWQPGLYGAAAPDGVGASGDN